MGTSACTVRSPDGSRDRPRDGLTPRPVRRCRHHDRRSALVDSGPQVSVLAVQKWPNNGHLIAAVAGLHITNRDAPWVKQGRQPDVMDVTYGRGVWWSVYRPENLTMHDRDDGPGRDGVDFRALPEADKSMDVVAFDPPYTSVGGRETTTIPDLHNRFGLTYAPTTPIGLQKYLINPGLDEVRRVTRPKGLALVKCSNYVSSGKLFPGAFYTLQHALDNGWKLVDWLDYITSGSAQPRDYQCRSCIDGNLQRAVITDGVPTVEDYPCPTCNGTGSRQRAERHARQNRSTLYVLTPK